MRIGILTLFNDARPDGIARYVRELLRAILDIDDENEYFLIHEKDDGGFGDHPKVENVRLDTGKRGIISSISRNFRVRRLGSKLGLDLLHGPYHGVPFGPFKRVITVHDLMPILTDWPVREHRLQFKYILPMMLRTVDGVVCVSENTRKDMMEHYSGVDASKVRVIHPGARTVVTGAEEDRKALDGMGLGSPFILWVSNFDPHKNHIGLVKAFEKLRGDRDLDLVFVGDASKAVELREYVDRKGLCDEVKFTGRITDEELAALYKGTRLFVAPSFYEGFSSPLAEALSYGAPAVVSTGGALTETYGPAEGGMTFPPDDIEEMARTIGAALEDGEKRDALVRRCRERGSYFSYERCAGEHIEFYRSIVP